MIRMLLIHSFTIVVTMLSPQVRQNNILPLLSYVRSGYIFLPRSALEYVAGLGFNWSLLATSDVSRAYFLCLDTISTIPSHHFYHYVRYVAFPVLSYVRSGWLTPNQNWIQMVGSQGNNYSELTQGKGNHVYFLYIGTTNIDTLNHTERHYAFPRPLTHWFKMQ